MTTGLVLRISGKMVLVVAGHAAVTNVASSGASAASHRLDYTTSTAVENAAGNLADDSKEEEESHSVYEGSIEGHDTGSVECIEAEVDGDYLEKIVCNGCGKTSTLSAPTEHGSYGQGRMLTCELCGNSFTYVKCPKCDKIQYYNATTYKQNSKCTCDGCGLEFYQVNCPLCGVANLGKHFEDGDISQCGLCHKSYQVFSCPHCEAVHQWTMNKARAGVVYKCRECGGYYQFSYCCYCHLAAMRTKGFEANVSTIDCEHCGKKPTVSICPYCKTASTYESYNMGLPMMCHRCDKKYQEVMCMYCKVVNYFNGTLNNFEWVKCGACGKAFGQFNCKKCGDLYGYTGNCTEAVCDDCS